MESVSRHLSVQWLVASAPVVLLGFLIAGPATGGGPGSRDSVTRVRVSCARAHGQLVLAILDSEDLQALDPKTGAPAAYVPPEAQAVPQPGSILGPVMALLPHLKGGSADIAQVTAVDGSVEAWLRPHAPPLKADIKSIAAAANRLKLALDADLAWNQVASHVSVIVRRAPPPAAKGHWFHVRATASPPTAPSARRCSVPAGVPTNALVSALGSMGRAVVVPTGTKTTISSDKKTRTRSQLFRASGAHLGLEGLVGALRSIERTHCVTVTELRFATRFGKNGAATMTDSVVRVSVRTQWQRSEELLRSASRTAIDTRKMMSLNVSCPLGRVAELARLLSLEGMSLRTIPDGKLVRPKSPRRLRSRTSGARVISRLLALLSPLGLSLVSAEMESGRATLSIEIELPTAQSRASDQRQATQLLDKALRAASFDSYLRHNITGSRVGHGLRSLVTSARFRIPVFLTLTDYDAQSWQSAAGAEGIAVNDQQVGALVRGHGLLIAAGKDLSRSVIMDRRRGIASSRLVARLAGPPPPPARLARLLTQLEKESGAAAVKLKWARPGHAEEDAASPRAAMKYTVVGLEREFQIWPPVK